MAGIEAIEAYLSGLLGNLAPGARSLLARLIARRLRDSQAKRIAAQQNPDGSAFAPRKPRLRKQKGALRRTMFAKMRQAKYLKAQSSADSAIVTFTGQVQRIANVHQFGLRDRVENRSGSPTVKYAARELLGITQDEQKMIGDMVLEHLAKS